MIYEYHCQDCDAEFQDICPVAERNIDKVCPECGGSGKRMVSIPAIKADLMSDRWVKNRESHMKQERKNMRNHGTYK